MEVAKLNDGQLMPRLGFGVWRITPEDTQTAVLAALEVGYRSLDTATIYGNEVEVGAAIARSGLARDELFVTAKVWNDDQGREATIRACHTSLERLGLDQVDLYLIHWPVPSHGRYVETWEALIELRDLGLVRSIGVSNFQAEHLEQVIGETGVVPAVNQVELHPWLQQRDLRRACAGLGVTVEAWAPLGEGRYLDAPALLKIAERVGATPAQVVLRWHLQLGHVVIPKTTHPERMRENLAALAAPALTDDDLLTIRTMDLGRRLGPHPDTFDG